MEILYVYCKDCKEVNEVQIREEEKGRGIPKGTKCPNTKCKSTNIVED